MRSLENNYDSQSWRERASAFFKSMGLFGLLSQALAFISGTVESLKLTHLYMLPALLLGNIIKAADSVKAFRHSPNKNISLLGAAIYDVVIAAGLPLSLFFLAVLPIGILTGAVGIVLTAAAYFAIETVYHVLASAVNGVKALLAPKGSIERKTYAQQALNHLSSALVSGTIAALFFVPMAQPVAVALALTAMVLSVARAAWQVSPNLRHRVKSFFGIEVMPDDTDEEIKLKPAMVQTLSMQTDSIRDRKLEKSHHPSLFARAYRKSVVNRYLALNHRDDAKAYLFDEIKQKLKQWPENATGKQEAKRAALNGAKKLLEAYTNEPEADRAPSSRQVQALMVNPQVSQSFFSDVSDTMDLLIAVETFVRKSQHVPALTNEITSPDHQLLTT